MHKFHESDYFLEFMEIYLWNLVKIIVLGSRNNRFNMDLSYFIVNSVNTTKIIRENTRKKRSKFKIKLVILQFKI